MSRPRRAVSPLWSAVPLFVLGLAGCEMSPRVWVEGQRTIELSTNDVEKLALYTLNGQIKVQPGDDDQILIVANIKAGGRDEADAQAALDAVEINLPLPGDDKTQEVRSQWPDDRRSHWAAKVSYEVMMPVDMALYAESLNGDIFVSGIRSECEMSSHNGSLRVEDAATELTASSHNGSITVDSPAEEINLSTHNGTIRAWLTNKNVQGQAATHNGAVRVQVAPEASFHFAMQVHNGHLDLGLPTTHIERSRREVEGRVGDDPGDRTLRLETHNGEVALALLDAGERATADARPVRRKGPEAARKEKEIGKRVRELEREYEAKAAE